MLLSGGLKVCFSCLNGRAETRIIRNILYPYQTRRTLPLAVMGNSSTNRTRTGTL